MEQLHSGRCFVHNSPVLSVSKSLPSSVFRERKGADSKHGGGDSETRYRERCRRAEVCSSGSGQLAFVPRPEGKAVSPSPVTPRASTLWPLKGRKVQGVDNGFQSHPAAVLIGFCQPVANSVYLGKGDPTEKVSNQMSLWDTFFLNG